MADRIPGPPTPPLIPGDVGVPDRDRLNALAATLSIFDWLDANGITGPELERVKTAFMFEHGPLAQRWLDEADPPPSWEQMAWLLRENDRLREALRLVRDEGPPLDMWANQEAAQAVVDALDARESR